MKKIIKWIDVNFEPLLITSLFYVMMALIMIQVVLRFIFKTGMPWAEEVARYMFVWLMYFSFSFATRNNRHIKVSFFTSFLPKTAARIIAIIGDLLFLALMGFAFFAAYLTCQSVIKFGDMAFTFPASLNVMYGAGLVGFGLMIIRIVQSMVWKITHFNDELEVFENYDGAYNGGATAVFMPKILQNTCKPQTDEEGGEK